ncbi:MAG: hypothetical protein HY791_01195 [Deltaproteobacteria bacterium]|nr:hypothetical protein [Deltaproteobacteria bacterium]
MKAHAELRLVVEWYFRSRFGQTEGPGTLPFYCDPSRVGVFAVEPAELAAGRDEALFRLFVGLSMFQALRDVVILRQQRSMSVAAARPLLDLEYLSGLVRGHRCSSLLAEHFESECDVAKLDGEVDCTRHPGLPCPVKDATTAFKRMGDIGKQPTSALRLWRDGGVPRLLQEVRADASPTARAELLVERFAQVHRVGRKLATMFVSALSTPALAPGLTPWFPEIDGNELVVVDTNVARAIDVLRRGKGAKTYGARVAWLRRHARDIDLRAHRNDVPSYSPRIVQQALYAFCSKSNRVAASDPCAVTACETCIGGLCPFAY